MMTVPSSSPAAQKAFFERYGAEAGCPMPPWNPVLDALFAHRSIRSYRPDLLPAGTVELLMGAAQSGATSSNLQMWSVIAVEKAETRAKLAELTGNQQHIAQAPLFLVFLADLSRAERLATGYGITPEAADYIDSFIVGTVDAAIAGQNATLAAESLGLGTVYIGAVRNKIDEVARLLNLPAKVYPVFGLVVGYPDAAVKTDIKPRLPQTVTLHRETYQVDNEARDVADYDKRFQAFQTKQSMPPTDWSRQLSSRVATKGGLNGRELLRQSLEKFGFHLK